MDRLALLGARAIASIGLLATFVYLAWRIGFSLDGASPWVSIPALAVEAVGFLASIVLIWALWPSTAASGWRPGVRPAADALIDVIVRVDGRGLPELRATLVAVQSVHRVGFCAVVDLGADPGVAALAIEFDAAYAATDPSDRNGLRVAASLGEADAFALLDAGDIPAPEMLVSLAHSLVVERVAVVQGVGIVGRGDTPEHGPNGVHEFELERRRLNRALSTRRAAMFLGSGALLRRAAVRDLPPGAIGEGSAVESAWQATAALFEAGWAIVSSPIEPVIVHASARTQEEVEDVRVQRALAARRLVMSPDGPLRSRRLTMAQRGALLASCVRPLSGGRRTVFIAVVVACLLTGSLPFEPDGRVLIATWLPGMACTSIGLALLSGWSIHPGDRARWSVQSLGPVLRSLRPVRFRPVRTSALSRTAHPGLAVAFVVVVLSIAIAARGISDRWTDTLGGLPPASLVGLVGVALWLLAISLDALRVLARRAQLRRELRVQASLPASLDGRPVFVVDLTARGAGVLIDVGGTAVSQRVDIDAVVPTASGITSVRLAALVRNERLDAGGGWRLGVEFATPDRAAANALAEHCAVEPARRLLGGEPPRQGPDRPLGGPMVPAPVDREGRRLALRVTSLLAVVGAIASAAPAAAAGQTGGARPIDVDGSLLATVVLVVAAVLGSSIILGTRRP